MRIDKPTDSEINQYRERLRKKRQRAVDLLISLQKVNINTKPGLGYMLRSIK